MFSTFFFFLRKKLFNFKYSQEIQLLSQDENGLFYERRYIEELSVNGEETWNMVCSKPFDQGY